MQYYIVQTIIYTNNLIKTTSKKRRFYGQKFKFKLKTMSMCRYAVSTKLNYF